MIFIYLFIKFNTKKYLIDLYFTIHQYYLGAFTSNPSNLSWLFYKSDLKKLLKYKR